MNDEIKEILDFLIQQVNYEDIKLMQKRASNITYYELKILLDYITNLQQENERLKEEKDNLYLDNTMLKMEKDIYKQGYEDLKDLLNILQNGSENNERI